MAFEVFYFIIRNMVLTVLINNYNITKFANEYLNTLKTQYLENKYHTDL